MGQIYSLYIGFAPDCTTAAAAAAAACPAGTGKSRRKDEPGENGRSWGGMEPAVSGYPC